jgi:hypothetical protein
MTVLVESLKAAVDDLSELDCPIALVGGLAVSTRAEPRFTRDADLVVAVNSDVAAEGAINALVLRGYSVASVIEQTALQRLATVRMRSRIPGGTMVDLLFASSGIEREIAQAAEPITIARDLRMPVARIGHLIALKVLSFDDANRRQDAIDLDELAKVAVEDDWELASRSCELIVSRGFNRNRDLVDLLGGWREKPST